MLPRLDSHWIQGRRAATAGSALHHRSPAPAVSAKPFRSSICFLRDRWHLAHWQPDNERRTAARTVFNLNLPALCFEEALYDGQTQTRPTRRSGWTAIEFFEDMWQRVGRKTGPVIRESEPKRSGFDDGADPHL